MTHLLHESSQNGTVHTVPDHHHDRILRLERHRTRRPLRRVPGVPYPESAPLRMRTLLLCLLVSLALWAVVLFFAVPPIRAAIAFVQRAIGA
jgi:hypothetical protein